MATVEDLTPHDRLTRCRLRRDRVFEGPPRQADEEIRTRYSQMKGDRQIRNYYPICGEVVAGSFPGEDLIGKTVVYVG